MSSLRERVEGLGKRWRNKAQLDRNKQGEMNERLQRGETVTIEAASGPMKDLRETCADELAAALETEGQTIKYDHVRDEAWIDGRLFVPVLTQADRRTGPAAAPSLHKEGAPAQGEALNQLVIDMNALVDYVDRKPIAQNYGVAPNAIRSWAVRIAALAASPAGRAADDTKLWRISQAVKLQNQNDLAGLQQFYDYVKGVVEGPFLVI